MQDNWTFEEFSTFAMLYAASVDAEMGVEEETLIKGRVDEATFGKVKAYFERCADIKCIDVLRSYHDKYMADEASRQRLLGAVREVFESDQKYSVFERELMRLFDRLL
ncbi:MAG: hypothetical protein KDC66_20280 [Phaeodactylibacter sp.]|nr:hypothetical protein [Phaeodactylibacter sp.]MCB9274003.1 hypothetical protein [Lewinellaceae bacterium]